MKKKLTPLNSGYRLDDGNASTGGKWRCPVCTFLSCMESEQCTKCHEPVTKQQRLQYIVARTKQPVKTALRPATNYDSSSATLSALTKPPHKPTVSLASALPQPVSTVSKPTQRHSETAVGARAGLLASASAASSEVTCTASDNEQFSAWHPPEYKTDSLSSIPPQNSMSNATSPSMPHAASAKPSFPRSASSHPPPKPKKTIKATELSKIHKGDLGYTASKANVHTFVHSKLNHDTAAYRGKFEDEKEQKKAGNNVHTLSSTITNGFTSSSAPKKFNRHDETPVEKPAKYHTSSSAPKGQAQPSWISALQTAASSEAVASLKHNGRPTHMPSVKANADGTYSKLAL